MWFGFLRPAARSFPEKNRACYFYHSLIVPKLGWLCTGYQGFIRAPRKKIWELQPDIVHGQGTERDCALSAVFSGFPQRAHSSRKYAAHCDGESIPPFLVSLVGRKTGTSDPLQNRRGGLHHPLYPGGGDRADEQKLGGTHAGRSLPGGIWKFIVRCLTAAHKSL